ALSTLESGPGSRIRRRRPHEPFRRRLTDGDQAAATLGPMELSEKLAVLADAAKYDASCASSGGPRRDAPRGGIGSTGGHEARSGRGPLAGLLPRMALV